MFKYFCLFFLLPLVAISNDSANDLFYKGNYKKLEEFLSNKDLNDELSLLKGRFAYLKCDFATAELVFRSLNKEHANDEALFYLFHSLTAQAKFDEAERLIETISDDQRLVARVVISLWYRLRGRDSDASAINRSLKSQNRRKRLSPQDYFYYAAALQDYDPVSSYNSMQRAYRKDKKRHEYHILAARHCLNYYALNYARGENKAVLKYNKNHPDALIGQATDAFNNGAYGNAANTANQVLKSFPKHIDAHILLSSIALVRNNNRKAEKLLLRAHDISPGNLDVISALAAFYEVEDNTEERDRYIDTALDINPFYAAVYTTMAGACERVHRTESVLKWGREAIQCNPRYWASYYQTGVALLRLGEEKEGYQLLDKSFELNAFNFWAKNMLTLLDRDFRYGEYKVLETEHFVIKYHQDEDGILSGYLKEIVESSWRTYTKKYGFKPRGPKEYNGKILFLIFKKHSNFSVRTVGIPGLGAAGATFGQLITMPSPIAMHGADNSSAAFNFKRVFDHEFVHVLTLQMSNYKIPRWLTEGISTWEENDFDISTDSLYKWAWLTEQLPSIATMNEGFVDQKYPGQIGVSYYQAALFTDYYTKCYGFNKLLTSLNMMKINVPCYDALAQSAGVSKEQLQQDFDQVLENWSRNILLVPKIENKFTDGLKERHPLCKREQEILVQVLGQQGQFSDAEKIINSVQDKFQKARLYAILGQSFKESQKAQEYYKKALVLNENDGLANYCLAKQAVSEGGDAEAYLRKAIKAYPRYSPDEETINPYAMLDNILKEKDNTIERLSYLVRQSNNNEKSYRAAYTCGLVFQQEKNYKKARKFFQRALWINTYAVDAHLRMAECLKEEKKVLEALSEYKTVLKLDPYSQTALESALQLARQYSPQHVESILQQLKKHFPDSTLLIEAKKSAELNQ